MPLILRKSVGETYLERVKATPNAIGFQLKSQSPDQGPVGLWRQLTYGEFNQDCRQISFGLMGLGIAPGDRVAIISDTRLEWALSDMAIIGAAAVPVPIYPSLLADEVTHILDHSESKVAIVEDSTQLGKVLENRERLGKLEKIVVIDPSAMVLAASRKEVVSLTALREIGRREEAKNPGRFESNLMSARPEDLLTICYTSGTTGTPKGAMITHDNMMSVLEDCAKLLSPHVTPENETLLTFLPFSHMLGRVEEMATYVFGWRSCFNDSAPRLMSNLAEVRPTLLFAVPRAFEKAFARVKEVLDDGTVAQRRISSWAVETGYRYYSALWAKKSPSIKDFTGYQAARSLVFRRVLTAFGGRLRFAICGGAPLSKEIGQFFQILGIQILEGYGLTETCAPVAVNTPEQLKFGTVGRPLPEVSMKIAEDGEVLVKSRKVFAGYYKMPEETAQVLSGGWLHTGDIGNFDSEGYLSITDRKKDLIVMSTGKNVAPQKIENLLKLQKFISQAVVFGDRKSYLTALITLDRDLTMEYANQQQILFSDYSSLLNNPKIQSLIQKMVDDVNLKLPSFEMIRKFIILPEDFSVEGGQLTPSLKVKRQLISDRYQRELESLYSS
jgi:long-chain acyl-CoA synthetase